MRADDLRLFVVPYDLADLPEGLEHRHERQEGED